MIGLGLLVIKHHENINEVHKVSPWELVGVHNYPENGKKLLNHAHQMKWEPDSYGDRWHELAADIIVVVCAWDESIKLLERSAWYEK